MFIPAKLFYSAGFNNCTITIPSTVTSIGNSAFDGFFGNSGISGLVFADGSRLTSIGDNAFIGTAIETLTIPNSVMEIGSKAFASCNNLTSVTLPRRFESQVADIFGKHASNIQFTFVD